MGITHEVETILPIVLKFYAIIFGNPNFKEKEFEDDVFKAIKETGNAFKDFYDGDLQPFVKKYAKYVPIHFESEEEETENQMKDIIASNSDSDNKKKVQGKNLRFRQREDVQDEFMKAQNEANRRLKEYD